MIGSLRGEVLEKDDEALLVEVGGVGYRLFVPTRILAGIPKGSIDFFYTSMQVREDAMQLYGFTSLAEKKLFEQLLGVSKVGPKVAIAMLSSFTPPALKEAIFLSDIAGISKVPGIGKKTAERVILELKDKIGSAADITMGAGTSGFAATDGFSAETGSNGAVALAEAREALSGLGYSIQEIQESLRGFSAAGTQEPRAEEYVRFALSRLASGR